MCRMQTLWALAVLALTVPFLQGHEAQEPKKPEPKKLDAKAKELMRRKLDHSQKILEAITMNNFDQIAKHADELMQVSKQAEFLVIKTRDYELYRDEFRRSGESLARAAKEKNIHAAGLAYLEMSLSCFHCHQYARDVGWTSFEPFSR